jgi:hypothetical protein
MAETSAVEQRSRREGRFNIPENDGYHYVIAEKPHADDQGSSPLDHLDDLEYEQVGESRRKVLLRVPIDQYNARLAREREQSQRVAKTPPKVAEGKDSAQIDGVVDNYVDELPGTPRVEDFLGTRDPDAD